MECQHKRTITHTAIKGFTFCLDCHTTFYNDIEEETHEEWRKLNEGMEPTNLT